MSTRKINLEQFVEREIAALNRFKQEWIQDNKIDPKNFPMKLTPGEWDEQLQFWD